ncbi:mitochondrial 37S ribosomal protein mS38 [Aspergillus lucknowensis]|uniref:Small ribosomal subunit protein mS38 n=1 Tax=Aspergillus lucknowensis TaxID=176173 RepID=A0ABR4LGK7_9EURO
MLSSSLRRAVWAPIVSAPGLCRSSSQGLAASSACIVRTTQARQRRYSSSSSKPSDGSRRFDASSQTPTKGVNSEEKREGKSSRRRGKDGSSRTSSKSNQPGAFSRLPSVPSTQHLQPHDVHIASFFSIHRPISVSTTVPPPSSPEAFDSIFVSRLPLKGGADDVIFTLSSAVSSMENAAHHLAENDSHMSAFEVEGSQFDGLDMSELKVSVEEMTKRLRPFNPPPPPVPFDEPNEATAAQSGDLHQSQETSSYSTVLTIQESTHSDGSKTYEAHTTPFIQARSMEAPGADEAEAIIDAPHNSETTYIERARNNASMHALSTKRRRKLKMKKHKFKKLLRRTRTLRRKLDKA